MSEAIPPRLEAMAAALWPAPARVSLARGRRDTSSTERYLVLPSTNRPRLLVPDNDPGTASSAVVNSSVGSGGAAGMARVAGGAALRRGLSRLLPVRRLVVEHPPGSSGLLPWLAEQASVPADSMAVRLGSTRANQKPVLQLMARGGQVTGYAKVGTNALTRALVTAEQAALVRVATSPTSVIEAPTVLAFGPWGDTVVLALSPLAIPAITSPADDLLLPAMAEIARMGPQASHPLAEGPYGRSLRTRLAAVSDPGGSELRDRVERLLGHLGEREVQLASWHGDFRPWNVAPLDGRLLVWDWERHDSMVPLGFDAVHYHHPIVAPETPAPDWQAQIAANAPEVRDLVAGLDVDADHLDLLTTLHGVELVLRHLEDVSILASIRRDGDVRAGLELLDHRLATVHRPGA